MHTSSVLVNNNAYTDSLCDVQQLHAAMRVGRERQGLCKECNEIHGGCMSNQLVSESAPLCPSEC